MKKFTLMLFLAVVFGFGIAKVSAECTYADINNYRSQATNMKFKYEIAKKVDGVGAGDGDDIPVTRTYMKIYIYNLTKDLKMTMWDKAIKKKWEFTYDDVKDGVIIFESEDVSRIIKYDFEIYAVDQTCDTDVLRVSSLRVPKYNNFYQLEMCEETPEFYLCQEFIETDKTFEQFVNERETYLVKNTETKEEEVVEDSFWDNMVNALNKYKFVILGVVGLGAVGTYVIVKKKRSRIV